MLALLRVRGKQVGKQELLRGALARVSNEGQGRGQKVYELNKRAVHLPRSLLWDLWERVFHE